MMRMVFTLNTDNFNGTRDVTCYSCHRGNTDPVAIPSLNGTARAESAPGTGVATTILPSTRQILEDAAQAMGRQGTVASITSRTARGHEISGGRTVPIEVYTDASGKRVVIRHVDGGEATEVVDGQRLGRPHLGVLRESFTVPMSPARNSTLACDFLLTFRSGFRK